MTTKYILEFWSSDIEVCPDHKTVRWVYESKEEARKQLFNIRNTYPNQPSLERGITWNVWGDAYDINLYDDDGNLLWSNYPTPENDEYESTSPV